MERTAALRLLSPPQAQLLTLAEDGLDHTEIASRLSLEPSAVGPALAVARAKLAALEARDGAPGDGTGGTSR